MLNAIYNTFNILNTQEKIFEDLLSEKEKALLGEIRKKTYINGECTMYIN
jgi:hypothetical protein